MMIKAKAEIDKIGDVRYCVRNRVEYTARDWVWDMIKVNLLKKYSKIYRESDKKRNLLRITVNDNVGDI